MSLLKGKEEPICFARSDELTHRNFLLSYCIRTNFLFGMFLKPPKLLPFIFLIKAFRSQVISCLVLTDRSLLVQCTNTYVKKNCMRTEYYNVP